MHIYCIYKRPTSLLVIQRQALFEVTLNYSFWRCFLWGRRFPSISHLSTKEKRKMQIHFYLKYHDFQTKSWCFSFRRKKKNMHLPLVKGRSPSSTLPSGFLTATLTTAVSCSGYLGWMQRGTGKRCREGAPGALEGLKRPPRSRGPWREPFCNCGGERRSPGSQHPSAMNRKYLLHHHRQAGSEQGNIWCCAQLVKVPLPLWESIRVETNSSNMFRCGQKHQEIEQDHPYP